MKLPQFNNTTHYSPHGGSYAIPAIPGSSSGERSIYMQADEDEGDIYACVRGVGGGEEQPGPCHCYLKWVRRGRVLDSRGYFVQGPAKEWDTSGTCTLVKENASSSDWKAATDTYDRRKAEEYGLLTNNCCTAAVEGANAVPKGGAPLKLYTANAGVGTVCVLQ